MADPFARCFVVVTVELASGDREEFVSGEMPEVAADILLRDLADSRVVKARKERAKTEEPEP